MQFSPKKGCRNIICWTALWFYIKCKADGIMPPARSGLPCEQGVVCHHGINLSANAGNVLLVFGVVENSLYEGGYDCHHVLLDTTGCDGGSAQTDT